MVSDATYDNISLGSNISLFVKISTKSFEQALVPKITEKDIRMIRVITDQCIINFIEFIFFLDKANSIGWILASWYLIAIKDLQLIRILTN